MTLHSEDVERPVSCSVVGRFTASQIMIIRLNDIFRNKHEDVNIRPWALSGAFSGL